MKVTTLARKIAMIEGKKKSVSIAQILEILRIINVLSDGFFYSFVRRCL